MDLIKLWDEGNKTTYGEETELQMRINRWRKKIGLDPKLLAYHYVKMIK